MVLAKVLGGAAGALAVVALLASASGAPSTHELELGKRVYRKANCIGCHKWHGGGGGGYGGAALSLRATQLTRDQMIEVVSCGRPGTRMPYHDRDAYGTTKCYGGMTKADLGNDFPARAAIFLRPAEIEAVVAYVQTTLQGKGEPTKADCFAFWGPHERQCQEMK
jgi:mono/diheme cytochrome c family protein